MAEKYNKIIDNKSIINHQTQETNSCCQCFYNCFGCWKDKSLFQSQFQQFIQDEKKESDKFFMTLTKLYANNEVTDETLDKLSEIRLNPNFKDDLKYRNDLEFYIPQLCTFLLYGERKEIEKLFAFLYNVCNASFFFAHRLHWFLTSLIEVNQEESLILENIKIINTLFSSANEQENNRLSKIYLSYSKAFIEYIKENNLEILYSVKDPFSITQDKLSFKQQEILDKYKESFDLIENYSQKELEKALNNEKMTLNNSYKQLEKNDFFIHIMNLNTPNTTSSSNATDQIDFFHLSDTKEDINFKSYYSALTFICNLNDLSNQLATLPNNEQKDFLYKELYKININLPGMAYVPFLKKSTRNYFICHIPLAEVKIFRTKSRAPIMLTIEIIRIDDLFNNQIELNSYDRFSIVEPMLPNSIQRTTILEENDIALSRPIKINHNANKKSIYNKLKKIDYADDLRQVLTYNPNRHYSNTIFKESYKEIELMELINEKDNQELINNDEHEIDSVIKERLETIDLPNIFGESFENQHKRIKESSLFGNYKTHRIIQAIIKTNEDLRQEQFATQLINEFNQIFQLEKCSCWLNTYEIITTGDHSGLIEMIPNSLSLDQLKQKTNGMSLRNFFIEYFNETNDYKNEKIDYKTAMNNYINSLAGYSLVSYFLQIKDRHNGNILIDSEGHLIHIDFGFLLSNAPGKGLKFERAPFKLTNDMVECLGGTSSEYFRQFQQCLQKGYSAVKKNGNKINIMVEMMWCGHGTNLPCFENKEKTIADLKLRLNPTTPIDELVEQLIGQSVNNWRTKWYDLIQYQLQGIFY